MPKKRWSAHDERKYEAILKSCKLSRGRKKGVTKTCKRIAAATVERDRGLADLGLGGLRSIPSRGMGRLSRNREGLTFEEWRAAAGVPASTPGIHAAWAKSEDPTEWRAASSRGVKGLGSAWQKGDRELKSGAWFKRNGNRMAIVSDADDTLAPPTRGAVLLSISEGDDETFSEYLPDLAAAEAVVRERGLGGTPAQHRKEAARLLDSAQAMKDRRYPDEYVQKAIARAAQEARWLPKADRERDSARAMRIELQDFPPELVPFRGASGLGCACADAPSGLGGRKRRRRK